MKAIQIALAALAAAVALTTVPSAGKYLLNNLPDSAKIGSIIKPE